MFSDGAGLEALPGEDGEVRCLIAAKAPLKRVPDELNRARTPMPTEAPSPAKVLLTAES